MSQGVLKYLPISKVHPNDVALRAVDKDDEKFIGLADSIREKGVLNPVVVREIKDPENGQTAYVLVDGLHRYTGALAVGLTEIPCHVISLNEMGVLEAQIIGNIHKVETHLSQYSAQLNRLLALNPTMTVSELAKKLGKSTTWISDRLGLVKLKDDILKLVDGGQINMTNAANLSKLPPEEQSDFAQRAITMSPAQFVPTVAARVKELRDAKRQGRKAEGVKEFEPIAHLQNKGDIEKEANSPVIGRGLLNQYGITDALDAWQIALKWSLHLDPLSVEAQRAKDAENKRLAEEEKVKKRAEREKLKAQEAAAMAATLNA